MRKRIALAVLAGLSVAAILVACSTTDRGTWIGSQVDASVESPPGDR